MDDRIAARRRSVREQRRRRRLRRTLVGLLVLLLVGALIVVERSALVALEEVTVEGLERLDEATVLEALAFEEGASTVRPGIGPARARLVALPMVRDAQVVRSGPRSVRVTVEERRPVLVARGGGVLRLVDRDGVVIATGSDPTLTEVRLTGAPPAVGETVESQRPLADALVLWRALSGPVRAELVRIEAPSEDDLALTLTSGTRVRIGRADRVDEKVRALGAILEDLGEVPAATIDVRSPAAPVIVPR
jgi:cell division protein FtsQ